MLLKKNFIVHNFKDYDEIYNKYFLKPGATIFVDFGWVFNFHKRTDMDQGASKGSQKEVKTK